MSPILTSTWTSHRAILVTIAANPWSASSEARRLQQQPAVAAAIRGARAALPGRCDASSECWLLDANPDAKTEDGKPATRLTFGEKVRALELQGRALGFLSRIST